MSSSTIRSVQPASVRKLSPMRREGTTSASPFSLMSSVCPSTGTMSAPSAPTTETLNIRRAARWALRRGKRRRSAANARRRLMIELIVLSIAGEVSRKHGRRARPRVAAHYIPFGGRGNKKGKYSFDKPTASCAGCAHRGDHRVRRIRDAGGRARRRIATTTSKPIDFGGLDETVRRLLPGWRGEHRLFWAGITV